MAHPNAVNLDGNVVAQPDDLVFRNAQLPHIIGVDLADGFGSRYSAEKGLQICAESLAVCRGYHPLLQVQCAAMEWAEVKGGCRRRRNFAGRDELFGLVAGTESFDAEGVDGRAGIRKFRLWNFVGYTAWEIPSAAEGTADRETGVDATQRKELALFYGWFRRELGYWPALGRRPYVGRRVIAQEFVGIRLPQQRIQIVTRYQ